MMMNEPSPSIPNPHISDVGSASRSSLAPGFRFHPTDEELVSYYLKRKVKGLSLRVDAIAELDLYKKEPWELPHYSRLRSRDKEWYFFSPLDRKYSNRSRTNRATAAGYWKTTGKDRPVKHLAKTVGMKKTLVFHAGRAPRGKRTNWVMHEYRMGDEDEQQQQMNNPNVLQASFVVCRIFEKNGTGPQNGAQYGAPFLEEEWEEDGVPVGVLMDNAYSGGEQGSVHPDEFEQKHIVDQHESTATVVAESERKDIGSLSEDSAIFLEDILDLDRFDSEPGLQNSPNNINKINLEEHSEIGLLSHSPSGRNDAYMELKDIVDNINMDRPLSGFDGVLLGVGNDRTLALDNSANETAVLPEVDSTEFNFDIANETSIDQELSKLCSPTYGIFDLQSDNFLNNYVVGDYQSGQLYEDSNVFYDAPSSDPPFAAAHNFTNSSNSQFSPGADLRGFDMVDELVTYFDAPDNDLLYDNWDSSLKSEFVPEVDDNFHSTWEADLKVPQTYTENNASSSSRFVEANHQFESKNEDDTVAPGVGANKSWNKSITNRVVDMLGSISAPPAMAEGSMKGKGVLGLVSASQSSSSIHVSAGMIQIHGSTVMGSAEHWTLQKNRDTSFLVSYGMSSDNDGFTKMHGGILGMLLRGGFYLFGISALLLSVSYKVVMCVCSK